MSKIASVLSSHGFKHAWNVDFEFVADPGHKPIPICMVAKCMITGTEIRLWGEQLKNCPFDMTADDLFIAYYASAETSCFDVLGWPRPQRMLDLFPEFRRHTNGVGATYGNGLLGALHYFGLPGIGGDEKDAMRNLILRGGPWTLEEQEAIIAYCESDVDALALLVEAMVEFIASDPRRLGQALLRGRYSAALGIVENNGIPIDAALLARLREYWSDILLHLVELVDADFGVFDRGRFVEAWFERYLSKNNIPWPRLASGGLALDDDTFRQQAKSYPLLSPLHELRHTRSQLRLTDLNVGGDKRARTMLSMFRSKTGRNQPSNSRFIFGMPAWFRNLVKPAEGRALAYVDWSSQEIAIAGSLSGDALLWEAYASGDPYIAFAIQSGLAPEGATKKSHPEIRQACKAIVLGVLYGMSAEGIANQSGIHVVKARELLQLHRDTYRQFWKWAEENADRVSLGFPLETVFGWRIHFPAGCGTPVNRRSILNWPMQSHGAEMMRLGVCMAVEEGLMICAPIHDALLLEAPIDQIDELSERLAEIMGDASELVLGDGKRCRSDIKIIRHPDRFEEDERGKVMFAKVMRLLEEAEERAKANEPVCV